MRIVALSDTHMHHYKVEVPEGDVLVFAGDFMTDGFRPSEVYNFADWFCSRPHKNKVWIAGNHDRIVEKFKTAVLDIFKDINYASQPCTYLENSGITIDGVTFWGSPYTPWFNDWAFNVKGEAIKNKYWDRIPHDTQVLITHGPPEGHLDECFSIQNKKIEHLGCPYLDATVHKVEPVCHIFGHIHSGYGQEVSALLGTNYYNVAICNEQYKPTNPATVIDID